jgi:hypothetical protein
MTTSLVGGPADRAPTEVDEVEVGWQVGHVCAAEVGRGACVGGLLLGDGDTDVGDVGADCCGTEVGPGSGEQLVGAGTGASWSTRWPRMVPARASQLEVFEGRAARTKGVGGQAVAGGSDLVPAGGIGFGGLLKRSGRAAEARSEPAVRHGVYRKRSN